MRIKILKPGLTILGEVREVGAIVNDGDPNECHNLVSDGRAAYLSTEEDAAEQAKDEAPVKPSVRLFGIPFSPQTKAEQRAELDAEEAKIESEKVNLENK